MSLTGDASCSGTCGKGDGTFIRTGTPGLSVLGTATCAQEFDPEQASDPIHLSETECMSVYEDLLFVLGVLL